MLLFQQIIFYNIAINIFLLQLAYANNRNFAIFTP